MHLPLRRRLLRTLGGNYDPEDQAVRERLAEEAVAVHREEEEEGAVLEA